MSKQLSTLPVGAIVKSVNTKYNGAVIRFVVGKKATDRVGLVTERIITLKAFDAKEPSNSNSDRKNYGKFQSTLPMRGATSCPDDHVQGLHISIHAPHAGSDHDL